LFVFVILIAFYDYILISEFSLFFFLDSLFNVLFLFFIVCCFFFFFFFFFFFVLGFLFLYF